MSRDPLVVAVDTAPLHGHRTGVAVAAQHLVERLGRRDDVDVVPYLVSFRARPVPPERRLPLPAAVAMRCWARTDRPRVDRWLRGVDVVHGTNYVAPPSSIPTVISVYDCWFLAHPDESAPDVHRAAAVLRRAVARGALVHVSSAATADVATDLLGTDRVAVVHLGPPDPAPATAPPDSRPAPLPDGLDGRPFVLALGTVERRKDVPALVRAFAALATGDADLHLVVAGGAGDDSDRLAATIDQVDAPARARIHVLGRVDDATKHRLLSGARVLAYPSLDEGFGFPILEAQQHGTPVVASRVGSVPEVGGSGVELVDPGSDDALTAGLAQVLTDTARRDELVRAGRQNLERFSWTATADGLVDLYRRAIEEQT